MKALRAALRETLEFRYETRGKVVREVLRVAGKKISLMRP